MHGKYSLEKSKGGESYKTVCIMARRRQRWNFLCLLDIRRKSEAQVYSAIKKSKKRFLVVLSLTSWICVFPEVQNEKQFVIDSLSHFINNHFLKSYPWHEVVWELPPDTFKKPPDFTPVLILLITGCSDDAPNIFSSLTWKTVYKVTFLSALSGPLLGVASLSAPLVLVKHGVCYI